MAKKKITQLDPATSVNSDALFPLSQLDNSENKTFKGTIEQLGDYINKSQDFNTLNTTSKKVIGAINEVLADANKDIISSIDTPAPIMTFNDGGDNIPVNKLLVAVTAQQSGSGTPSPDNVRSISGWSQVQISVSDGVTPIVTTIAFGDTYYGGVLDVTNGKLTVTKKYWEYDGDTDEAWQIVSGTGKFYIVQTDVVDTYNAYKYSNIYPFSGSVTSSAGVTVDKSFYTQRDENVSGYNRIWVYNSDYSTVEQFKTALANQHLQIVADLIVPVVINLTPAQITTLSGLNNIYADCGDIQLLEYFNGNADDVAELNRAMSDDFHIYSTAEQIVGKWLGEDLYEKSYHYTQATVPAQNTAVTIDSDTSGLNIKSIAAFFCTYKIHHISGNYDQWITDSTTTTQINNNQLLFYQKATTAQQNFNNLEVNIVLRYTKAS